MAEANKTAVTVVGGTDKRFGRKNILLGLSLGVLIIAALVFVGIIMHQNSLQKERASLVGQAVTDLDPSKAEQLGRIVGQIKQVPGYDHDADCLYVLTLYYIQSSDATNANKYYGQLAKVYNDKKGYSNPSLKTAQSLGQLKGSVDFIAQLKKEAQQNVFYAPPEPKQ